MRYILKILFSRYALYKFIVPKFGDRMRFAEFAPYIENCLDVEEILPRRGTS